MALNETTAFDIIAQSEVVRKLRERYADVPQAFFIRSLEKAKSLGDLFDILDTIPSEFPIEWNSQERRWFTNKNLFPKSHF